MLKLPTRTQKLIHLGMPLVLGAILFLSGSAGGAWDHPRGDSANTGFEKVNTLPAADPMGVPGVGPIAPGANPVIGPDGTVYVGNQNGLLMAFHPDGSEAWSRRLNPNQGSIVASPVVGADGSIYVVSTYNVIVRRDGQTEKHNESWLHKFTPGGGWLFALPFPELSYPGGVSTQGGTV